MKLIVTLERDETGMIVAECPAIPGCVSQGKTEEEALANIREAVQGCLEARAAQGMPLMVAMRSCSSPVISPASPSPNIANSPPAPYARSSAPRE
jgi:predicted RNase H-like HicB family nuclease